MGTREGAIEANREADQRRTWTIAEQQLAVLEEIRDLLKIMVRPDQHDPRLR